MKEANISVELIDHCGSDLSVVNAARVSFAKESEWDTQGDLDTGDIVGNKLKTGDERLIKYLAEHRHKSPFNHAFMSFRVKAPIFVARQLVKHEYLPWNEVSRRYVTDNPEFYFPTEWRAKADNVKQGSSDQTVQTFDLPERMTLDAYNTYKSLLGLGVCPEQARMVLPQNMMTEWIWSGTLYAFAKMCVLRLDSHTQKETRLVAEAIDKEAKVLYPTSWEYLVTNKHAV